MKRGKPVATLEQIIERFWSRVEKTDSCWFWTRACNEKGYGVFRIGAPGKLHFAHRFAYELAKGPIPEGLHLDHLCRTPRCCNPSHLEAVTPRENWRRGISPSAKRAKQVVCSKGHPFDYMRPDKHGRQCLTCKHEYWKVWYEKNKERLQEKERARTKSKMLGAVQ